MKDKVIQSHGFMVGFATGVLFMVAAYLAIFNRNDVDVACFKLPPGKSSEVKP